MADPVGIGLIGTGRVAALHANPVNAVAGLEVAAGASRGRSRRSGPGSTSSSGSPLPPPSTRSNSYR